MRSPPRCSRSRSARAAATTTAAVSRARPRPRRPAPGVLRWALAERPTTLDPLYARTAADRLAARQLHEPLAETLQRAVRRRRVPAAAWPARSSRREQSGLAGAAAHRRALCRRRPVRRRGRARQRPALAGRPRQGQAVPASFSSTRPAPRWSASSFPRPIPDFDGRLAYPRWDRLAAGDRRRRRREVDAEPRARQRHRRRSSFASAAPTGCCWRGTPSGGAARAASARASTSSS